MKSEENLNEPEISSPAPEEKNQKAFSLVFLRGLGKKTALEEALPVYDSNRSSTSFYFMLQNNTDQTISNIKLTTSNSSFEISPNHIDLLEPMNSVTIAPILKISAIHGQEINGFGYRDLMPMGYTKTEITTDSSSYP